MSDGREAATRVLLRVTDEGAYAAAVLDAEIRRAGLDRRDAALATEIVYGTLRALGAVDAALGAFLTRPGEKLDAHTRAALRAATYQILCLARVPPHAAVDAAVGIVRRKRGPKLAGLANAVLRKVAATRPAEPAPPVRLAAPAWLERSLREALGEARASAFLEARELPPPVGLRVERGTREELVEAIHAARPDARVSLGEISPLAVLVRGAGDPRALPGYADGVFAIQEQGAQAVALLAGARPGERVADACAGRGGKTTLFARLTSGPGPRVTFESCTLTSGPGPRVSALDVHESKLERIGEELARLGIPRESVETRAVDLTVGTGGIDGTMDRVIVDAPCTGLGTVHRRPEILLRVGPDDPARMAELQVAILRNASRMLRPGGVLVYAVCSPTRAEGTGVAEAVAREIPALVPVPPDEPWLLDTVAPDADGIVRIGPWTGDADAYQVIRWTRATA